MAIITTEDDILEPTKDIYELIVDAMREATRENIKADSIVINDNLVKVPERFGEYPAMICGLKTYRTSYDLPEDYLFAVLHDARPMTNADRLRAMSDKELALFLTEKYANESVFRLREQGYNPTATQIKALHEGLYMTWMQWLRQPVEVE